MSDWRSRMHPTVAAAELVVFAELSRQHLTRGMTTQKWVVLRKPDGTKIRTKPDFFFQLLRKLLYLDGDEVHIWKIINRDNEIMELLADNDYEGLRIRYHAPLVERSPELYAIAEEVKAFICAVNGI